MNCRAILALAIVSGVLVPAGQGQNKTLEHSLYPLQVGSTWTYKVSEKEGKSSQQVTVKVEKIETIELEGKKVTAARLEIKSGDRKLSEHVAIQADGFYRFSSADKTITPNGLRFFKTPANKGETWQVDAATDGTKLKGAFTIGNDTVAVPYFKGEKRPVFTSTSQDFQIGPNKMTVTYWFADKIGIVKQHVVVGNFDQTMELESFTPGSPPEKK